MKDAVIEEHEISVIDVSRNSMRRAVCWEKRRAKRAVTACIYNRGEGKHSYVLSRSYVRFVLTENLPRSDPSRMREGSSEVVMMIGDDE